MLAYWPHPYPEVSVSKTKGLEESRKVSTGAFVSICCNYLNLFWQVRVHSNEVSFFVNA